MNVSFYEALEVRKDATQQQIKQSYKKLALKYHPDKNEDKESAKVKFRQISEAYAVLNDPQKRQKYDVYGEEGLDLDGMNFEQFAENYAFFQSFIDELIGFNDFQAMLSSLPNKKGKKKGKGGRVKKNINQKVNLEQFDQVMGGMMEAMMLDAMMQGQQFDLTDLMDMDEVQLEKLAKEMEKQEEDEDQEDLTEQQMQILRFGEESIEKTKGKKKKKTVIKCKFDGKKIEEDEILMHFSENHGNEFKEWQKKQKL